jgi:AcrR family transcriptional regulator
MSTSPSRAYHHGALKTALLDAADALLDEGGAGAVSLREAARRAGVSATAPYRHFADKEALLAALATRGFEQFGAALEDAARDESDPLAAMGLAYVRFALARPGRFRLMFGPGISDRSRFPDLQAAAARAFGRLVACVEANPRPGREPGAGRDARVRAIAAWALVHGLAQLFLDGMLPGHDPEALVRAITRRAPAGG